MPPKRSAATKSTTPAAAAKRTVPAPAAKRGARRRCTPKPKPATQVRNGLVSTDTEDAT